MKNIIFIILIQSYIFSITLSMENNLTDIFTNFKTLKVISTNSTQESLDNIKNNISDFAIVRGDLLYLSFNGISDFNFTNYYLISQLQIFNYLYFIGRERSTIRYVTDLRNKKISIGKLGNLGNYFLKQMLNRIQTLEYSVHFYSNSIEESLEKISSKKFDYLFAFSKKKLEKDISKYFLKDITLESKFKKILLKNLGLKDGEHIQVQYYLISSNKVTNIQLMDLMEYMRNNDLLNSKISPKYGLINPLIEELLVELKNLIRKKKDEKVKTVEKDKLYKELLLLKDKAIKNIVILRGELNKLTRAINFLSKYSQKLIFFEKVNEVNNNIASSRKLLNSISINTTLDNISIESIKLKQTEINQIIKNYMLLLDSIKSNIINIKIILAKEQE